MVFGKILWINFVLLIFVRKSVANDFPSLLVANATLGIILDQEYLGNTYESTLEQMKEIVEQVIREDLRGAGLQVKYYSWSRINFNKGEKFKLFCENLGIFTWKTEHFNPKKLRITQRKIILINQETMHFVQKLRILAKNCEFEPKIYAL